ncbi:MAG: DUF2892 domain-containing protein [Candidatus Paceibacterota bacterium]
MNITKNIGTLDRVIRFIFAEIFFLLAFFWTYGAVQIVLYVLAAAMLVTASFRFCGLYTLLGIKTCPAEEKSESKVGKFFAFLVFILIAALGSYYSNFFTKKFFLEDYSKMNQYYKQTLFYTGQNNRAESLNNYANLVTEYDIFYQKYSKYHPYVISGDVKFNADIKHIQDIIASLKENVASGDLPRTHKEFELVRPLFQDILKRNNFSMLAVYLVDFHDAMEKIITAADEKNATQIISVYPEVNDKLKAVEDLANDTEIQTIRQKLEQVVSSARDNNVEVLSSQAAELKSSFVKVYLKRG